MNSCSDFSLVYVSASRHLLLSANYAHCADPRMRAESTWLETYMSHLAHRGWGGVYFLQHHTVSLTLWYTKCTHIAVLLVSVPGTLPRGIAVVPP